jgi:hypothetical protein
MGTQGGVLLGVLPGFIFIGHSSPGFARSGEVLSLACPRESTQREGHPNPSSAGADALRFSPNRASRASRSQDGIYAPVLACLEQGALLLPGLAAVLGEGNGGWALSPKPVGAAEHRSRFGIKRAALFELDLQAAGAANPASSASAQTGEKRREPASAGKPSGPPFCWVLFFGGAKKSTSPSGRNPAQITPNKENLPTKPGIHTRTRKAAENHPYLIYRFYFDILNFNATLPLSIWH